MASLKEIKGRIGSVEGTLKITSAMKMVASAKLHKAQVAIENMLPYDRQLHKIMVSLLSGDAKVTTPLSQPHDRIKRIAVVAVASNSSLCGGYNSNVLRHTTALLDEYKKTLTKPEAEAAEAIDCYVIGRKLDQSLAKLRGFNHIRQYVERGDNPKFETAKELAEKLMKDYVEGRIDKVELVYMHFKSTASQVPTREVFLPLELKTDSTGEGPTGYIIEPTQTEVLNALVPDALCMKIYTMMLDAQAAEHAARTVAMQTATDNANDLLGELRIQYNKGRQAAITAELLDIVGGSMQ
ncbi:MAG: ATP synthase F1 subunit gamma [Bacteroidales bacterium]|nr:ATP synthase F1 subunit gamma [Candidatus Liminaster caballi]